MAILSFLLIGMSLHEGMFQRGVVEKSFLVQGSANGMMGRGEGIRLEDTSRAKASEPQTTTLWAKHLAPRWEADCFYCSRRATAIQH